MTVKSDNLCTMLDNIAPCYVFNKYMSVIIVGFYQYYHSKRSLGVA